MIEVSLPVFIAVYGGLAIVVIIAIVFVIKKLRRKAPAWLDTEHVEKTRTKISVMIDSKSDVQYTLAIIEADKLLDFLLKSNHFPGNTLGERLKVACYKHQQLRAVWPAHKMRNKLVHDHDVTLTEREARKFWNDYQAAYSILMR